MQTLHPALIKIRTRIIERSKKTRAQYLNSLPTGPTTRTSIGCANLAHTTAIYQPDERLKIAVHRKPHLGIVTAYNDMLSAHQPFAHYPEQIAQIAHTVGATTQVAGGTPAMCDGITQGREGMELSLFSRDVIALSACVGLSHDVFDGGILLGVCDKIAPGLLIGALAFGHLPFVFIPAGPMTSGLSNPEKARIRQLAAEHKADRSTLLHAEEAAYHSSGTCTFYGTANSNQLMLDFMGLQFPGGAFCHPNSPERQQLLTSSVHALIHACETQYPLTSAFSTSNHAPPPPTHSRRLADLVNVSSLLNALVGLMASGGSTNHTIHWMAVARAAGFLIDWTDLDDISRITPLLTRVYPNGSEDVNAFHHAGGTGYLLRTLIEHGLVDGSVRTLWGCTLEENLNLSPFIAPHQSSNLDVLRPANNPFANDGGIRLLQGNLGRSICKVSAVKPEHRVIHAPCRVFQDQQAVINAFDAGEFTENIVVVVTHQGPRANGMPELHKLTPLLGVLQDRGLAVALLTDGRMSGASGKVLSAIHLTPEAQSQGPIAKLRDGDLIHIDANQGLLDTTAPLHERTAQVAPHWPLNQGRSYFNAWRHMVNTAEQGATHLFEDYNDSPTAQGQVTE